MSAELANVIPLFATGAASDETVRRTIRALIEGRGMKIEDVADEIGMNRATLYRRLGGRGARQAFSAGETATLAKYFKVSIERLYDGLGGAFLPPTNPDGTLALGVEATDTESAD